MIVGKDTWELIGTTKQIEILLPVFTIESPSFISFPWNKIVALPRKPIPISWGNLNDGTLLVGASKDRIATHPHIHDMDGNLGHGISRPSVEGRLMIAGVFWSDGRIKIDTSLENRPSVAREVLSAEIAHAVDYGMPFTDQHKALLTKLLHGGGTDQHTWWERQNYGSEYYSLVGEAWMALFTHSYSGMTPWQDPFLHKSTKAMAPQVHTILGVQPILQTSKVYSLRGYKIFHLRTHLVSSWLADPKTRGRVQEWPNAVNAVANGKVPCRVCKPL